MWTLVHLYDQRRLHIATKLLADGDTNRLAELVQNNPTLATKLLTVAIKLHRKEAFEILLNAKADPSMRSTEPLPPIHLAAGMDDAYWLERILAHQGDPNKLARCPGFCRPMHIAIENNRIENVRLLIKSGAVLSARLPDGGGSYLTQALSRRHGEIAYILLEAGIEYNPFVRPELSPVYALQNLSIHNAGRTPREQRDYEYLLKCIGWFHSRGLDVLNATRPVTQDVGRWDFPSIEGNERIEQVRPF